MAGQAIVHDSPIGGNEPRYAYAAFYRAAPVDRIKVIKAGVSARQLKLFISDLHFEQKTFFQALRLKTATVNKKAAAGQTLTADESERVLGLAKRQGSMRTCGFLAGCTSPCQLWVIANRWTCSTRWKVRHLCRRRSRKSRAEHMRECHAMADCDRGPELHG